MVEPASTFSSTDAALAIVASPMRTRRRLVAYVERTRGLFVDEGCGKIQEVYFVLQCASDFWISRFGEYHLWKIHTMIILIVIIRLNITSFTFIVLLKAKSKLLVIF